MLVLMAIDALLSACLIDLVLVALRAVRRLVLAYKRELGLEVMVKRRLFPIGRRVALFANAAKLLFMHVILLMAIEARRRQGLVFALHVALVAIDLEVLSVQQIGRSCRGVMVKRRGLPFLY